MSDFFDDLGKKLTEAADDLGRRAGETIEVQKVKSQIRSLKRANERDYTDIGRMVYQKFTEGVLEGTDYMALCEAIEKRHAEIGEKEADLGKIKGREV